MRIREEKNLKNSPVSRSRFLIVGGGIAGLRATLEAAPHGRTLLINKGLDEPSSSTFAQGGIAVALSAQNDQLAAHRRDTLQAGHGLCRDDAVRVLVEEGPERVQELIEWGACFDRVDGKWLLTREAAHSESRILRARGDATGDEIVKTLARRVRELKTLEVLEGHFVVDLWVEEGVCRGVLLLEEGARRLFWVGAEKVILATGGVGQVYLRTTNPPVATGDGMSIAARAGALLEDMEFVQFHPTALSKPGAPSFLLSEAMRGEGAVLRNSEGRAFMWDYDPAGELAPRDRVARAIWEEMGEKKERTVFLDLTHLDPEFTKRRFPTIYRTCLLYGTDITQEWIPVAPSAHYIMGGVKADPWGRTTLKNLLVAGEVACTGVHGANRLASNSLLEGLVFGARCAKKAVEESFDPSMVHLNPPELHMDAGLDHSEVKNIREGLRRVMWEKVGIVRNRAGLTEALDLIDAWLIKGGHSSPEKSSLELRNLLIVGRSICAAALRREDSVGSHFRSDYPDPPVKPYHITV